MNRKIYLIFLIFQFLFVAYGEEMRGYIVLWEYDPSITAYNLNGNDIKFVEKKLKPAYKIDLSEFSYFDIQNNKFVFKENSIMQKEILEIGNQLYCKYKTGELYFSIVVNNKIIFSGLNRLSDEYCGAKRKEGDDFNLLYLVQVSDGSLKLSRNYTVAMIYDTNEKIYIENNFYVILKSIMKMN